MSKIAIIAGSKSDLKVLETGLSLLKELDISYSLEIISAHRHPEKLRKYCLKLNRDKEVKVAITVAGLAAALGGAVASYLDIPVIGVPLKGGLLDGLDAIFSMLSLPRGIALGVSGVGENGFINAIILALEILSLGDKNYLLKLKKIKNKFCKS